MFLFSKIPIHDIMGLQEAKKEAYTLLKKQQKKLGKSYSEGTLKTYAGAIAHYVIYTKSVQKTPNDTKYISMLFERYKVSTALNKIAALQCYFRLTSNKKQLFEGLELEHLIAEAKRKKGVRKKQAKAFTLPYFKSRLDLLQNNTASGIRNKAMLLIFFTGAMRVSELIQLNVGDITFHGENAILDIKKSKTNQFGDYQEKALYPAKHKKYCPVTALKALLKLLPKHKKQPLFTRLYQNGHLSKKRLSISGISLLTKRLLDETFSNHSYRASFVTILKREGVDNSAIRRQTGHTSDASLETYMRFYDVLEHNAAAQLDL